MEYGINNRSQLADAANPDIHGCRSEAAEAKARRGFSQVRATQAYSQQYVEEAEGEEPRRASESAAAVGIRG